MIRKAEGRDYDDGSICTDLPACPAGNPLAWQWRIRRRSYRALLRMLNREADASANVLDLGAGVGWLSNRLREAGYCPCAVDLSSDRSDGLGAARHFSQDWPRVIAEFDRLPLEAGSTDVAIFNASFHYSTDYAETLSEAKRVVRPGGLIVVLDSPVYHSKCSGERMLEEQAAGFEKRFGTRSDSLPVRGFLTWGELEQLAGRLGLEWHVHKPWYGLRWAARPWIARLRKRREPASFVLLWART